MTTVIINVCGKIFETDLTTITKAQLFKNVIDDTGIPDKPIFINRSPKLFEHVLAYLIDSEYPFPLKYQSELKYFLIDYDPAKLYDPIKHIKFDIEHMKLDMRNLERKINIKNLECATCFNCAELPVLSYRCKIHLDNPLCVKCGDQCNRDEKYCYWCKDLYDN